MLLLIIAILFIISLVVSHYDSYDNPDSIIWPSLTIVCFNEKGHTMFQGGFVYETFISGIAC